MFVKCRSGYKSKHHQEINNSKLLEQINLLSMRFLKKKIALAMASDAHRTEPQSKPKPTKVFEKPSDQGTKVRRTRVPGFSSTSEASRATKNIVKNDGRAICSFAMSHLAYPYLNDIVEQEGLLLGEFLNYMKEIELRLMACSTSGQQFLLAQTIAKTWQRRREPWLQVVRCLSSFTV